MLVQFGNDATGHGYKKHLENMGVGTKYVKILDGVDSGFSLIFIIFRISIYHGIERWKQLNHNLWCFK